MPSERDRTRLIAELASLLHECHLPEDARCASLTLIGWLARRMPGEAASTDGVEHAQRQMDGRCGALAASTPGMTVSKQAMASRVTRALIARGRRDRPGEPGGGAA